jgi:hypothetical protein
MVMSPVGLGIKNDCVGEGQQLFTPSPTYRPNRITGSWTEKGGCVWGKLTHYFLVVLSPNFITLQVINIYSSLGHEGCIWMIKSKKRSWKLRRRNFFLFCLIFNWFCSQSHIILFSVPQNVKIEPIVTNNEFWPFSRLTTQGLPCRHAALAYEYIGNETRGLQTTARGPHPARHVILSGPRKNYAEMHQLS